MYVVLPSSEGKLQFETLGLRNELPLNLFDVIQMKSLQKIMPSEFYF